MYPYKGNRVRPARVVVLLDSAEVNRIDKIGVSLGMRSRSEAIRSMLRRSLDAEEAKSPAGAPTPPDHDQTPTPSKDGGIDA